METSAIIDLWRDVMFNIRRKNFSKLDILLILSFLALVGLGLLTLYSATLSLDHVSLKSQVIATFIGFALIILLLFIDYEFLKKASKYLYILGVFLMILVNLFGTGAETWGSDNWLVIGPISFQPSEFMKIFLILGLAWYIDKNYSKFNEPLTFIKIAIFALLPVVLILKEDFGTALATVGILIAMFFAAGISWRYIALAAGSVIVALPIIYANLDGYQKDRILDFLDPSRDIAGSGLQAMQGKIAIGSGMLTGRGLFKGVQNQNNFIPEKHTDYIFPVLAEELGFIGVALTLFLYTLCLLRILDTGKKAKDIYGTMVCMGVFGLFLVHIFENIGMTVGVMPVTGIPLPFFSFGGTSQLVNLIAIGLVLHVRIEKSELEFSNF